MKYEKAEAVVVEFEVEDVITTSNGNYENDQICAQPSMDAEICDGQLQAATKPF